MSKKTGGSDVLTKDYLDQALSKGFGKFRGVLTEEFDTKLTFRLGMQKDEILRETKDMITTAHSKLYERIDPLLSEVENARVDRELGT